MEVMEEVKGYSDSREELEEEEEAAEEIITREESSSSISRLHHHQDAASNFINHTARKQLDFMDLSLGTSHHHREANNFHGSLGHHYATTSTSTSSSSSYANNSHLNNQPVEKEHMFDKVVTPSDVGKLNRLVIPKQHAEKYFPLDSNANEKGLLLNFEDRSGKLWRFRYSYWNSSQSYVMTKGWSRFVKEKKLDAGDIVSFQRGVGELYRQRLYIDWRRRPENHHHHLHRHGHGPLDYPSSTTLITPFFLPNQQHLSSNYSIRWGTGRLYPLPSQPQAPQTNHPHDQQHFQHLNYNNMYPFHHHHHQQQQHGGGSLSHHYGYNNDVNSSGSGSVYYLRSTTTSMPLADTTTRQQQQQQEGGNNIAPMIIDSVPVAHHHHHHDHNQNHNHHGGTVSGNSSNNNTTSTAAKRLRLFGVNMECASSTAQEDSKSSSSLPPLQLLNEEPLLSSSSSAAATRFGDQRGGAATVFDLDPSLQYHHQ